MAYFGDEFRDFIKGILELSRQRRSPPIRGGNDFAGSYDFSAQQARLPTAFIKELQFGYKGLEGITKRNFARQVGSPAPFDKELLLFGEGTGDGIRKFNNRIKARRAGILAPSGAEIKIIVY